MKEIDHEAEANAEETRNEAPTPAKKAGQEQGGGEAGEEEIGEQFSCGVGASITLAKTTAEKVGRLR